MRFSWFFRFFLCLGVFLGSSNVFASTIYSKHWYGNKPFSIDTNQKEMLLFYDLFVVSFDPKKKFSRWVAYHLSPQLLWGSLKTRRDFQPDLLLLENNHFDLALDDDHYKGAFKEMEYDRGHLAPLASFKGSAYSSQLQYLTNIAPQKKDLNRKLWKDWEEKGRDFVRKGHELRVFTGLLYGDNSYGKPYNSSDKTLAPWKAVNGIVSQIPSGFWKMFSYKNEEGIITHCIFVLPQNLKPNKIQEITKEKLEAYTGLIFFDRIKSSNLKNSCKFLKK